MTCSFLALWRPKASIAFGLTVTPNKGTFANRTNKTSECHIATATNSSTIKHKIQFHYKHVSLLFYRLPSPPTMRLRRSSRRNHRRSSRRIHVVVILAKSLASGAVVINTTYVHFCPSLVVYQGSTKSDKIGSRLTVSHTNLHL